MNYYSLWSFHLIFKVVDYLLLIRLADLLKSYVINIGRKIMHAKLDRSKNIFATIPNFYKFINTFKVEISYIIKINYRCSIFVSIEIVNNKIQCLY